MRAFYVGVKVSSRAIPDGKICFTDKVLLFIKILLLKLQQKGKIIADRFK